MNKFKEFIEVIDNVKSEKKPTLKMRYLQDVCEDTKLALSVYYHNLIPKCPSPRWNSEQATDSDIMTAVIYIITNGGVDAKEYYKLPFVTQKVLFYMSQSSDFGLQNAHILSTSGVFTKPEVFTKLNLAPLTVGTKLCARCWDATEDYLCSKCIDILVNTLDFRLGNFTLYGVSRTNFNIKIRNWDITSDGGLYTFSMNEAPNEQYEPKLPFEEYQDNLSILS